MQNDSTTRAFDIAILDSIETSSPGVKILLFADNTWKYWKDPSVILKNDVFSDNWNTETAVPYRVEQKDLPEKMEEVRYARFDEAQQKVYDGQVVRMKQMIASADANTDRIKILAELTRIRQICCDPSLILENYEGESAKKDACLQLIQSAIDGGHKMLVFSQFTSMLEILRKELDENKIGYYVITGATPKEERLKLVHRFNENDVPVFLISLKAGGTGLNLTGADVVIHYDPWWNLAAQNQATDRAHRIGPKSTVTVYRIIAKDTIEERILELQEAKKDLSDAILSGEASSLAALSKEELMELLG